MDSFKRFLLCTFVFVLNTVCAAWNVHLENYGIAVINVMAGFYLLTVMHMLEARD